jgi:pimeloyl-ACP methyl ester carboxylesterase
VDGVPAVTHRPLRIEASDGTPLFARLYGRATASPAMVCLPGLTRNSRDFTQLASASSADRLVVCPDLRGRGESGYDPTGATYRADVYVDDVLAVLDTAGVERAVFVGTSLGGQVSMLLASAHPGRVAGIVLNDVGPKLEPEGIIRIRSYAGKLPSASTWDDAVEQIVSLGGPMVGTLDGTEWRRLARQQYREFAPGNIRPDHDPAVAAGLDAVDPYALPESWSVFDAIGSVPILVIRGAESDLFAASTVDEMARRHPQLRAITIADRGHCPTLDEPACRAAIAAFLREAG